MFVQVRVVEGQHHEPRLHALQLTSHVKHRFWAELPPMEVDAFQQATGHQQVMDAYLVSLANFHRGRVVTFDSRLKAHAADDALVTTITA